MSDPISAGYTGAERLVWFSFKMDACSVMQGWDRGVGRGSVFVWLWGAVISIAGASGSLELLLGGICALLAVVCEPVGVRE